MKSLLLVIDVQKSFVNNETMNCVKEIEKLIVSKKFDFVAFTKFLNKENSNFYKELNYKGCLSLEDREIVIDVKNNRVFEKNTYSSLTEELKHYISENNIEIIYLTGIDTNACVLKTALDLFDMKIKVKVIEKACMSHSGIHFHNNAIELLKKLIGDQNII